MANHYSSSSGFINETGVCASGASAVVMPGHTLLLSNANYAFTQLICSNANGNPAFAASADNTGIGAIALGTTKPGTLTIGNSKLVLTKVGGVIKVPSKPSIPSGMMA